MTKIYIVTIQIHGEDPYSTVWLSKESAMNHVPLVSNEDNIVTLQETELIE